MVSENLTYSREELEVIPTPEDLAQEFIQQSEVIFQLPITVSAEEEHAHLDRFYASLRNNAGTPFIEKHVKSRYGMKLLKASASPEMALAIPELLGINPDKGQLGIFSPEGAKDFELEQLVRVEPNSILQLINRGKIRESELARKLHREWRGAFRDHYGSTYNATQNLSRIYPNPNDQHAWRRKYKGIL